MTDVDQVTQAMREKRDFVTTPTVFLAALAKLGRLDEETTESGHICTECGTVHKDCLHLCEVS